MAPDNDHEFSDEKRQRCVVCSVHSPSAETNYTLISAKHGWRLVLSQDKRGDRVMTWYCPKCWAERRQSSA